MSAPLRMIETPTPGGVRLQVVGLSEAACEARYYLTVESGGGNRSVHSGSARLPAGREVSLATIAIGSPAAWTATMDVTACNGATYRSELHGPKG